MTEAIYAQRGNEAAMSPTGHRVDPDHEYEVRWLQPPGIAGHCLARMTTDEETLVLEFTDFEIEFDEEDLRWRPVFVTGSDGVAVLEAVAASGATPIG